MHRFIAGLPLLLLVILASQPALAKNDEPACNAMDRPCLLRQMEAITPTIDDVAWRDQTYRELAKTYTYEGKIDQALAIIPKVDTPDTRAMTIRGIGMAAAHLKLQPAQYQNLFTRLADEAKKITHPPSQAIAWTYIAMSQAFAGDDAGARATAATMQNSALRNKAYGETSEIEAERGDVKNALTSIGFIDTLSYRNKAYDTVSEIFINRALVAEAYQCANMIDNPYLKAKAIQRILNKGNKEQEDVEPHPDVTKELE